MHSIRAASPRYLHLAVGLMALVTLASCVRERPDVAALPSPRAGDSWIHDGAGVIGPRKADIDRVLDKLEADTGAEVAVVTLPTIGDAVPKDFATELFNAWGVGKKGEDNGVLILHVIDQRRVEIETGYGVESVLTDARAKSIIDRVTIPFFKADSFADGHYETVLAIEMTLRSGRSTGPIGSGRWERQPGESTQKPRSAADAPLPMQTAVQLDGPQEAWWVILGLAGWSLLLFVLGFIIDPYLVWRIYYWSGAADYAGAGTATYLLSDAQWSGELTPWVLTALSPVGVLGWRWGLKKWLQRRPRKCAECGEKVRKALAEEEDDKYLEAGQRAEERVDSVNYDVWLCSCGTHRVDRYQLWSSYGKCSRCGYRTSSSTSETIQAATYTSSGRAKVTTRCSHCGHSSVTYKTIPKLQKSSSSSSGGSSYGGGGSSFGGGSSGGGGAGGSY